MSQVTIRDLAPEVEARAEGGRPGRASRPTWTGVLPKVGTRTASG